MSDQTLREALEARKAEIDAALAALDRLEELAGIRQPPKPSINGKSYSQAVLDLVSDRPRSVDELSVELGITVEQVYNALTSHRLRKLVEGMVVNKRKVYGLKKKLPSISEAILAVLSDEPDTVYRPKELVDMLNGQVATTSTNVEANIFSTLTYLAKTGRIQREEDGYRLAEPDD